MVRNSVLIARPVEDVFDYAAQFERHTEWQDDLKAATFDGPAKVGAVGTETRQMGPRTHTYEWRVTEYERPRLLSFETLSGSIRPSGRMRFVAEGTGTRLDFEMDLNPRGFMKLLAPFIERQVQKTNDAHTAKFKEILERG